MALAKGTARPAAAMAGTDPIAVATAADSWEVDSGGEVASGAAATNDSGTSGPLARCGPGDVRSGGLGSCGATESASGPATVHTGASGCPKSWW